MPLHKTTNDLSKVRLRNSLPDITFNDKVVNVADSRVWTFESEAEADLFLDAHAAGELTAEIANLDEQISRAQSRVTDLQALRADAAQRKLDAENKVTG